MHWLQESIGLKNTVPPYTQCLRKKSQKKTEHDALVAGKHWAKKHCASLQPVPQKRITKKKKLDKGEILWMTH